MRVLRMTRMLRKDRNEETMSNLRCRALEDEYLGILRDLDGDAEGRALAATYLASAHPVANREGTPTWALTPKVLSSAELGILREAAETFGRILEKVTARFRRPARPLRPADRAGGARARPHRIRPQRPLRPRGRAL